MPFLSKVAEQAYSDQQRADEEAAAAAEAAQEAEARSRAHDVLVGAARERITQVLGHDADADVLVEEDVDPDERLVVLSDAVTALAVTLAGTDDAQVWLVRHDDGWTRVAQLSCLADLGAALAEREG